jgi:hypothetical protein
MKGFLGLEWLLNWFMANPLHDPSSLPKLLKIQTNHGERMAKTSLNIMIRCLQFFVMMRWIRMTLGSFFIIF